MNFSCAIHPPADRHDAAGGRAVSDRRRGLRFPAGRQPAERRIPDHPRQRSRPGADPNIMAATVAAPLERQLGDIAGVTEMTSTSSLGSSRISVQFDLSRNIEGAARDVQAALNAALTDLPGDLPTLPTFRKANPAAAPILILALTSKTMQASAIYDAADSVIAQRLSQVDGVADVTVAGAEQPAMRVRVDPARLSAMGLGMEDVRTAIANANAVSPLGSFDGGQARRDHRHQRSVARGQRLRPGSGEDRQRQCHSAIDGRKHRPERAQQPLRWLVQPRPFGAADHHQAGQRQCHRHGRPHLRTAARAAALDPGGHRHLGADRPHPDHPRQRARHAAHACRHRGAGDAGGVPVPAPDRGDASPPASPCRCRWPAPARRCGRPDFPSTICR